MKLEVVFRGRLEFADGPEGGNRSEDIECTLDRVEEELLELANIEDPIVSGSLASGEIEITMTASGNDVPAVFAECHTAMRTALHAAEVCTPDWETHNGGAIVTIVWDEQTVTGFGRTGEDSTGELQLA